MQDEPKYFTIQDAAEALGVNRKRIWRMIRDGQLEAITNPVDRREKLIPREAIERLLEFTQTKKDVA
jgi:excisionase family DNA binding protein